MIPKSSSRRTIRDHDDTKLEYELVVNFQGAGGDGIEVMGTRRCSLGGGVAARRSSGSTSSGPLSAEELEESLQGPGHVQGGIGQEIEEATSAEELEVSHPEVKALVKA